MVTKIISNIFDDIDIRLTYAVVDRMNDGRKYKKSQTMGKNRKLSRCIVIENDEDEIEGTIEFLKAYIKVGDLKGFTQIKIQEYIKKLKKQGNNNLNCQEKIDIIDVMTEKQQYETNEEVNQPITKSIDITEVLTQTEEMWNAFANSNKEKIFDILYSDKHILTQILTRIYN